MSCAEYRSALREMALGAPAAPDLEGHLSQCPQCRAALDEQRRLVAGLDREIQAALDVEPPADLLARVRLRVAEAGSPRPWAWRWLLPATLAAAAILVGVSLLGRRPALSPAAPRQAAVETPVRPSPVQESPAPEPRRQAPSAVAAVAPPAQSSELRPPLHTDPEVLVPPEEGAHLRRLAEAIRLRPFDASRLSTIGEGPEPEEAKVRADLPELYAVQMAPDPPRESSFVVETDLLTLPPDGKE